MFPYMETIWRWISTELSHFAWSNCITEHTSHLKQFWIDAAIRSTCCSNQTQRRNKEWSRKEEWWRLQSVFPTRSQNVLFIFLSACCTFTFWRRLAYYVSIYFIKFLLHSGEFTIINIKMFLLLPES